MPWQGRELRLPRILVLTWNLFHGRSVPAAGRPLLVEFCRTLAAWEWDVALLQEVPPWWPRLLGQAAGAGGRMSLTSRNAGFAVRKAVAARNPDLITANGGGCNAILARGHLIARHETVELTRKPERRTAHGVLLGDGLGWVVNMHGSTHPPETRKANQELAYASAQRWAGSERVPLIFGGDLNATRPAFTGMTHVAAHHVDHVFVRGWEADGEAERLDAGPLSDHVPLRVRLRARGATPPPAPPRAAGPPRPA